MREWQAGQVDPIVIHVYALNATGPAKLSVQWAELDAPLKAGSRPPTVPIPPAQLAPALPPSEVQRRELQDGLKAGWSTWCAPRRTHGQSPAAGPA